jgi:hypothetical protein
MVLRAFEHESESYSMLHAALDTNAPMQVIQRILIESPEQTRQMNTRGRYPLQVACELSANVETKDEIINLILDTDPRVALMQNESGQSILSIVAEFGGVSTPVIHRIIRLNPSAVTRLDPKHNLYPFMSAPVSKQVARPDNCIVGAIFALLSASPNLIKSL